MGKLNNGAGRAFGNTAAATTNRLMKAFDGTTLSSPYDEAGNLINHPYVSAMQYGAENRQKQFTSGSTTATYHYDGDGRRVKRVLGGQTAVFVYDAFGMLAAEYSTATPTEPATAATAPPTMIAATANEAELRRASARLVWHWV